MKLYTECYIEKGDRVLMLHRTKKQNDLMQNYWVGVGGRVEEGESPEEGIVREAKEESGYDIENPRIRGLITFVFEEPAHEDRHVAFYQAGTFTGEQIECDEGDLAWIDKDKVLDLPLHDGDPIFLRHILYDHRFFTGKFVIRGGRLAEHTFHVLD